MGKFDLGEGYSKVSTKVSKDRLHIEKNNADYLVNHIDDQLDIIRVSLLNVNNIMNQIVNKKIVSNSRSDIFKGWSRKAKSQAKETEKIKLHLNSNYNKALKKYTSDKIDECISVVKDRLDSISK